MLPGCLDVAKKIWNVVIAGQQHEVRVRWNSWVGSGEALVDGKVIDAWGPSWTGGGARRFQVAGEDTIVQSTASSYRLFVAGRKMKAGRKRENVIT